MTYELKQNEFLTDAGRVVMGHVYKPSYKGYEGKPNPIDEKTGKPKPRWFIGVAFKQGGPIEQIIQGMSQIALKARNNQIPNPYSWKILNGDVHPEREGWAGCYILCLGEWWQPKILDMDGKLQQDMSQEMIHVGDWIRVLFSVKDNGCQGGTAGMFVNPVIYQLVGYDKRIHTGPDYGELFGQAQVPAGTSATPVVGEFPALDLGGGAPQTASQGVFQPGGATTQPQSTGVPGGGFQPQAALQVALPAKPAQSAVGGGNLTLELPGQQPQVLQAPTGYIMNQSAPGTYEQYRQQYSDEQLIKACILVQIEAGGGQSPF